MNPKFFAKVLDGCRTDSQRDIALGLVTGWQSMADDVRTDADAMIYSARQLEHVFTQVYEEDWPDLVVANGEIMPIDRSVHEGADTWTYYLYTGTAVARLAADFSDGTLPRVTRSGAEMTRKCHDFENMYAYTTRDVRKAAMAKDSLPPALGKLAKRGHDQEFHRTGLWGRTELGTDGMLTLPNMTISTASESWETADVDEILDMVGTLISTVSQLTKNLRHVTRVLFSPRVADLLVQRRLGPGDGTLSLWDYLVTTYSKRPGGKPAVEFGELQELDWRTAQEEAAKGVANVDIDETTGDCAIAYVHNNAEVLSLVQPMPFKQYPVQFVGLEYQVPCESSTGGVRCPEPMTIHRMEGLHF